MRTRWSYSLIFLFTLLTVRETSAQESSRVQQAIRLFDAARESLGGGDLDQACAQFDQSERLDPQLGTKLHLADCYERQGKLASAWMYFRAAEMLAAERNAAGTVEPREKLAQRRAAKLSTRMPTLRLVVQNAPSQLRVTLDGRVLTRRTWGAPTPVDPGKHLLQVSAPGRISWQQSLDAEEQKHLEVLVPELTREATHETESAHSVHTPQPSAASLATAAATPPYIAYALGAAGLLAGGSGVVLGLITEATLSERDKLCPRDTCRDGQELQQVAELTRDARTTASLANVLMVTGGLAFAAGVTWLVVATGNGERKLSVAPSLSPHTLGLALHGHGF